MQPLLTPSQQELVTLAQRLATEFGERAVQHDRDASFPFDNFTDLHRGGYLRSEERRVGKECRL